MIELFLSGGVVMWPLAAVAAGVVWIAVRTMIRLRDPSHDPETIQWGLQALLFWGVMALTLGVLGTIVGLVIMAEAVVMAGSVEAPLVWGGVSVSLVSLLFGVLIFLLSALVWFGLRQWTGARSGATREAPAG